MIMSYNTIIIIHFPYFYTSTCSSPQWAYPNVSQMSWPQFLSEQGSNARPRFPDIKDATVCLMCYGRKSHWKDWTFMPDLIFEYAWCIMHRLHAVFSVIIYLDWSVYRYLHIYTYISLACFARSLRHISIEPPILSVDTTCRARI